MFFSFSFLVVLLWPMWNWKSIFLALGIICADLLCQMFLDARKKQQILSEVPPWLRK